MQFSDQIAPRILNQKLAGNKGEIRMEISSKFNPIFDWIYTEK